MSKLKIKDKNGKWVEITGIKGDKGDTGLKGDKGDAFTYADFTPEQLASLKGAKGDKGDAFEYSDFTPQQLASLKGEKGDKGEDGQDYVLTENDKQEIAGLVDVPVDDVQVNGTSIVNNGVANVPLANSNTYGVVKVGQGLRIDSNNLVMDRATDAQVQAGVTGYRPITPVNQHQSVFYGLAKAAGDTTQSSSSNTVGTYTDEAKSAIQSMLGVLSENEVVTDVQINGTSVINNGVAEIPYASLQNPGVIKVAGTYGVGIYENYLRIDRATLSLIKTGLDNDHPIVAQHQHEATFYGLAKAAGHDEKNSTLPVGQYTDSAKTAIKQMLDVKDDYDSLVVEVSGTDPVITGKPSYRYNCGELYTLSVTPPASGTMDIIFTSGTTPTVLTLPNTVKMPDWWAGIETNTTYEMCITDGTYCGVMSWAT